MAFTTDHLLQVLSGWPTPAAYRVALSGGLDSTVLLHALASVRDRLPAPVAAAHVDHGLHADSATWAGHCQALCDRLDVPLEVCSVTVPCETGDSPEAAARAARYAALAGVMAAGELLLTGQHADDQAETVLLQLLRGAGVAGLAAMAPYASLGPGALGRPLLGVDRNDLTDYAAAHRLAWLDDPSNEDTGYDRNYLRHQVMPRLRQRWPAMARTISRSAAHCAAADAVVSQAAAAALEPCLLSRHRLALYPLLQQPADQRDHIVRVWIARAGLPTPPAHKLAALWTEVIPAAEDRSPVLSWPGAEIRRYRDVLWLMSPLAAVPRDWTANWGGDGELLLPDGLGRLKTAGGIAGIDPQRWADGRITVAYRSEGLRCTPAGRQGSRSLKKLFQEGDVPPWLRERTPLIFIDGELAAVADHCVCKPFAAAGAGVRVVWQRPEVLGQGDEETTDEEE